MAGVTEAGMARPSAGSWSAGRARASRASRSPIRTGTATRASSRLALPRRALRPRGHGRRLRLGRGDPPFDEATDALGFLSEATMLEVRASERLVDDFPADVDGALQDLMQAREALANLAASVKAAGGSPLIGIQAAKASAQDTEALQEIDEISRRKGRLQELEKRLKQTGRNKKKIAALLARGGLLRKP